MVHQTDQEWYDFLLTTDMETLRKGYGTTEEILNTPPQDRDHGETIRALIHQHRQGTPATNPTITQLAKTLPQEEITIILNSTPPDTQTWFRQATQTNQ